MPRGKKNKSKCKRHEFLLKPAQNSCHFGHPIAASFCDPRWQKERPKEELKKVESCLHCPIFNNDRNHATYTFILESEKDFYVKNAVKLKVEHEIKAKEYEQQKSLIWIAKPRAKNSYCSVCREGYEDYKEHIETRKHKNKITNSRYNDYILELEQQFKKSHQLHSQSRDKPIIPTSIEESSSIQILEMGSRARKRVKREITLTNPPLTPSQNLDFLVPNRLPNLFQQRIQPNWFDPMNMYMTNNMNFAPPPICHEPFNPSFYQNWHFPNPMMGFNTQILPPPHIFSPYSQYPQFAMQRPPTQLQFSERFYPQNNLAMQNFLDYNQINFGYPEFKMNSSNLSTMGNLSPPIMNNFPVSPSPPRNPVHHTANCIVIDDD